MEPILSNTHGSLLSNFCGTIISSNVCGTNFEQRKSNQFWVMFVDYFWVTFVKLSLAARKVFECNTMTAQLHLVEILYVG